MPVERREPEDERGQRSEHANWDQDDQELCGLEERTDRLDAEGIRDARNGRLLHRCGVEQDREEDHRQHDPEPPREPSPPRRGQMPVREQQQQERDGKHHDRDPARLIERDEHEPGIPPAGVDQEAAELTGDRRDAEEDAHPRHQPPDRVLGSTRRQHVSDHREHREREHEADVPERVVAGAGRADRGDEERESEPDGEADQRDPGHDSSKQQVSARGDVAELRMFLHHGAMFARRGSAPKGAHPRIGREGGLAPARVPPRELDGQSLNGTRGGLRRNPCSSTSSYVAQ
jgi:hypothetical protein